MAVSKQELNYRLHDDCCATCADSYYNTYGDCCCKRLYHEDVVTMGGICDAYTKGDVEQTVALAQHATWATLPVMAHVNAARAAANTCMDCKFNFNGGLCRNSGNVIKNEKRACKEYQREGIEYIPPLEEPSVMEDLDEVINGATDIEYVEYAEKTCATCKGAFYDAEGVARCSTHNNGQLDLNDLSPCDKYELEG